jgi:hypothetical protein
LAIGEPLYFSPYHEHSVDALRHDTDRHRASVSSMFLIIVLCIFLCHL